mgnify:CR=1 FL=1
MINVYLSNLVNLIILFKIYENIYKIMMIIFNSYYDKMKIIYKY